MHSGRYGAEKGSLVGVWFGRAHAPSDQDREHRPMAIAKIGDGKKASRRTVGGAVWRRSGISAAFRSRSRRSPRVVKANEIRRLDRDDAALVRIAKPHFSKIASNETLAEQDPLLPRLLAAATVGAAPAGPATQRTPIRIVFDPADRPVGKGAVSGK
jgi:hypothetical protein